jgi:probable rRNA maturation factor
MLMASEIAVGGRQLPIPAETVQHAVRHVLEREDRQAALSVTFLGRDGMRRLNQRYKGQARPTDVLAFSLPDPGGTLVGDIYVCHWVARREAEARKIPIDEEIIRLVVHGTLHVLGYDHPDGDDRTAGDMWRRQETYVRALT